jgi:hypothetical protein
VIFIPMVATETLPRFFPSPVAPILTQLLWRLKSVGRGEELLKPHQQQPEVPTCRDYTWVESNKPSRRRFRMNQVRSSPRR